jgi:hypothetical protein
MFITGVNYTGDKVFTGVNDAGDSCHGFSVIAGVFHPRRKQLFMRSGI